MLFVRRTNQEIWEDIFHPESGVTYLTLTTPPLTCASAVAGVPEMCYCGKSADSKQFAPEIRGSAAQIHSKFAINDKRMGHVTTRTSGRSLKTAFVLCRTHQAYNHFDATLWHCSGGRQISAADYEAPGRAISHATNRHPKLPVKKALAPPLCAVVHVVIRSFPLANCH